MRHAIALLTACLLLLLAAPPPAGAAHYDVSVNGIRIATPTEMKNGQLMVGVRPFVEALGGKVDWYAPSQRITMTLPHTQVAIWLGTSKAFQDAKPIWATVAPYYKNGHSMVPGWWLASRLGLKVTFDGRTLHVVGGVAKNTVGALLNGLFPLPKGSGYVYQNTMGVPRPDGRTHEGIDIMVKKGTPVYAAHSGKIVRYGWLYLGGYRLTIQPDNAPSYTLYYAHLDRYAPDIALGQWVPKGKLLGYVGDTGYGPEGTRGQFEPHLHFGLYGPNGEAINCFPLLKAWEAAR